MGPLRTLAASSEPGDRLVFHYSGHGSQVRDADGDELTGGLDEILCPYDFDWDGSFIKDDDLASILGELAQGVSAEIIRDTGGSIARGELLKRVRASLKHEGFSQVPQLECPADRKVQAVSE